MSAFKVSFRHIPWWAFLLVLLVVVVNSLYLFFRFQIPDTGDEIEFRNGRVVITNVIPNSPADKAEIKPGDIIELQNSVIPTEEYYNLYRNRTGDTVTYLLSRGNEELSISVVCTSYMKKYIGFLLVLFVLILFLSIGSFYILVKKPNDLAARIFFIYIQLFAMATNAQNFYFKDPAAIFANMAFSLGGCLAVAVLIHFHLQFPRPSRILVRYKWFPWIFYLAGSVVPFIHNINYIKAIYDPTNERFATWGFTDRVQISWMTIAFAIAFSIAVYQFISNKSTLARNQIRLVIIGSFFGLITPMAFAVFYNSDFISRLFAEIPFFLVFSEGTGSLIMILFLLVAIFRYRIWGTEVFIRRALLYLFATFVITVSYLLLIYLVDLMTPAETNISRFFILAISVLLFLILRDRIQHLIDRIFHRESYDSANVVSEFETKLAGVYHLSELKSRIAQNLDEIFHFKSFVLSLKKNEFSYEPVSVMGLDVQQVGNEFEVTREIEGKLQRSKVFSPEELSTKHQIFDKTNGELIVPLLGGDQPYGFFICGPKRSERVYSHQDIRVLSLLARRVVALFNTAALYQKDLDQQLMLERERARISQDMHDDIGAGLTKIAMMSEAPVKQSGEQKEITERLSKVASSSREMISRLNVIVWALNPKYDNLESLIAYLRRFFGEYLENFGIRFIMEVPEVIPDLPITPDFRRNVFYAIQEAVHNAVKHGSCSEIGLTVVIPEWNLLITITDNGKGFETDNSGTFGNGLNNMKKRAEELGGSFLIESSPGIGTRIQFSIVLNENATKG